MTVSVRLPTILRSAAGGQATVEADGETIGQVFDSLIAAHPGLGDQLLTTDGELHRHLNVFLNDDDIRYLGRLDAKVSPSDTVTLDARRGRRLRHGSLREHPGPDR